jgi:hypothetical protein
MQATAMSYWVISVILVVGRRLPVFPREADIVTAGRHVSKVPKADANDIGCGSNCAVSEV